MALYEIAGLGGRKVELPVPLTVRLIPPTQKNQRPGIKRATPGFWVQHETANVSPGADAEMHCRWLHNGAGGQQLSFHFAVDDRAIYQMIPIDEVTWQAADGAGPGNMSGISSELCVNAGIDHARARRNAEALAGGILAALNMQADRVRKHQDFSGKWCPTRMLNEGYWPTFVRNVGAVIASGVPLPAPTYVAPGPKPGVWNGDDVVTPNAIFYAVGRRVQAKPGTRFRRYASPTSPETRAPAAGFELLEVEWAVQGAGGAWWWITDEGHRVLQAETTVSVVVTKR
jgi:hypothetical protein